MDGQANNGLFEVVLESHNDKFFFFKSPITRRVFARAGTLLKMTRIGAFFQPFPLERCSLKSRYI